MARTVLLLALLLGVGAVQAGVSQPAPSVKQMPPSSTSDNGYFDASGKWIGRPVRTPDNRPPPGASAQCEDGSFSFIRSRRACARHGGVSRWL